MKLMKLDCKEKYERLKNFMAELKTKSNSNSFFEMPDTLKNER
jgi:hypothetical protein